ncbi:hypothetical protein [Corallococcus macrosporus]|uniref:hypothetical protein n=1 Tax=Corallococcus macrosporus TaxID=35 RepID=UPI0012FDD52C|nr:hypothetical protein [Corallococcus macrosporus]
MKNWLTPALPPGFISGLQWRFRSEKVEQIQRFGFFTYEPAHFGSEFMTAGKLHG